MTHDTTSSPRTRHALLAGALTLGALFAPDAATQTTPESEEIQPRITRRTEGPDVVEVSGGPLRVDVQVRLDGALSLAEVRAQLGRVAASALLDRDWDEDGASGEGLALRLNFGF